MHGAVAIRTPLEAAQLRKKLTELVPADALGETFRQVIWSVEESALRRFESLKALNIALKKIRERAWSRPQPDATAVAHRGGGYDSAPVAPGAAARETCSAA